MSRYQQQQQASPAGHSGGSIGPVISHPRLHAVSKAKPYSRPSSYAGSSRNLAQLANGDGDADLHSRRASRLPSSGSSSSLPRSGSDSSLFSGIKSIFSKPFGWLATPSREYDASGALRSKRDSLSSFGNDVEDPESPSDRRDGKRLRRQSPERSANGEAQNGHGNGASPYEPQPTKFEVQGRAVSGFMLPALSPHITLKPKSHRTSPTSKPLPPFPTNFSRPLGGESSSVITTLSSSKSMSYLDPPSHLLRNGKSVASPSRAGPLTRSKRMELSSLADVEEPSPAPAESVHDAKGKGKEEWSPWKSKYPGISGAAAAAASPRVTTTPGRRTATQAADQRDYTLPSISPFRQPQSPLAKQATSASGLTRSATTANLRSARKNGLEGSSGLSRAGSLRPSGSMLFGLVNGDKEDDRMSVDGESRQREGSVLDWFMRDQWSAREPSSPASVAASRRLGGAPTTVGHPPLRKGQLVWNEEEKVFVRESDLKASKQPQPIHKSEAERILWTLESMRKTPLSDARKNDFYPSIIGQSSRTWRKTINVPLSTAAAGDNAKRRRDRLGDGDLSIMISPYGRRKAADEAAREVRRQRAETDNDYRPSPSPTPSVDERQESRSPAASARSASASQRAPSSAPSATPRRSSRIRQKEGTHEEAPTPKAKKSRRGVAAKEDVEMDEPSLATPRRARGGRGKGRSKADKGSSPPPKPSDSTVPAVPTITETAPSPGGPSASSLSTYQPGARSQESSSLRARSDSKRTHQSAAAYSRSATPSGGSGRYSAKEEDLPDLEELEKVSKIPLPSFAGITFAGLQPSVSPTPASADSSVPAPDASVVASPSQGVQPQSSLGLPPIGKRPVGPLARLGQSTRPRASSPLAAGSFVAEPESPPQTAKPKSPADIAAPAQSTNNFFSFDTNGSTPTVRLQVPGGSTTPAGKPPASSGFFAPPTQTDANKSAVENGERPSTIPNFFGNRSNPDSGTSTPKPAQIFDFGLSKPKPEEQKVVTGSSSFSFNAPALASQASAPATNGSAGFSFNATKSAESTKPVDAGAPAFSFGNSQPPEVASAKPAFSFGSPSPTPASAQPAEATKPLFSFGTSSVTPATEKSAEAAKAPFSFGASSTAPKPAEPAKSTFNFGVPSASTNAPTVANNASPSFTFGTPATDKPKELEAAKSSFSFGQSSTTAAKPAEPSKPAFTFGAPSATNDATKSPFATPAANGTPTPTTPSFAFGKSDATKPADAAKASAPANPFAASSSAPPAVQSSSFNFGPTPAAGASSPFGSNANQANGASNPFGQNATPPATAASTSFTFGKQPSTPAAASSTAQPANPFAFGSGSAAPASNPFGSAGPAQPAAPVATTSSFAFGAPAASTTPANPFGGAAQQQQPATPTAAQGFNFTFGAPASAGNTTPGGSPFTFGQNPPANQNSSRPTTPAASSGFAFGNPAPAATSAAPFAFGQSTTPASAPPTAGFTFGAPQAPGTPTGTSQPVFGAPAPDAGFSLGVGDPQTAGSPARRVKGLPSRRGGRR